MMTHPESQVFVGRTSDVETVRKVLPANFYPRPQVDSAIVLIKPNAEKRAKVGGVLRFRVFLRDLYVHRRKNLRQALIGWPTGARDKKDVDAKLAELGIDGTVRSETLYIEQHLFLKEDREVLVLLQLREDVLVASTLPGAVPDRVIHHVKLHAIVGDVVADLVLDPDDELLVRIDGLPV